MKQKSFEFWGLPNNSYFKYINIGKMFEKCIYIYFSKNLENCMQNLYTNTYIFFKLLKNLGSPKLGALSTKADNETFSCHNLPIFFSQNQINPPL